MELFGDAVESAQNMDVWPMKHGHSVVVYCPQKLHRLAGALGNSVNMTYSEW